MQLPIEDGSVPRDAVLLVLQSVCSDLQISLKISDDYHKVTLVKDGISEVLILGEERVTRRMLQRLSKKYGIRIEFFYHPEMYCTGNKTNH